ncbi:hypothetical protein KUTeg_011525 [Tegillarca granosa]|uniref:Ig-like domain-containing protein n=1 Tax=Tegillarca granosa TaxID=220873 RepID=A0ABQ9F237_TEGGR|nr:hypothetical protein KUTeg_011525 [Tegillarca granosa]
MMPRDLFFTGAEGYLNQTDLTASCYIKNFTHWNKMEIFKEDEPAITLYRDGEYNTSLGNVIVTTDMKPDIFYYAINMLFTTLSCSDKGRYSCAVDGQFIKEATVVVKTLPVGKPEIDLNGTIYGNRNVDFSCTGYTGYPVGKLKWMVQFETDADFRKYDFFNTIREQHETNCYQKEKKTVNHEFGIKWNGARLRCQAENSTDYDEVQIWLMPRDLFFNGGQGFEGSTGLSAKCSIQNFTHWNTIEILKNDISVVTYTANGKTTSNLDSGVSIIPTSKPDDFYYDVELQFNNLRCNDEATYTCNVDNAFAKQTLVTVNTPPKGKPTINLKSELYDNWDVTFSCHGNSGYPNGSLGWKVKYEKASEFIDFEFENINRQLTDSNCQRTETLEVKHLFSLDWNGAIIRCQARDSEEFGEVQIWLVPKGISFTGADDYLGTKNLISECIIQNFTVWHQLTVTKDNKPIVTLLNNGSLTHSLPDNIVVSEERKHLQVALSMRLNELKCENEGNYICSVDNELSSTTNIKVKTEPKGMPKLDLNGNIYGNKDVIFSCSGYPGYPDGKLKWQVKFERDTNFRDYEFTNTTRVYDDKGCEHFETVTVRNLFTIDWNGAKLRCLLPSNTEYAEADIWLMPRDLVLTNAVGLLNSKTTQMKCSIYNFTTWGQIEIYKKNDSFVTLTSDGKVNYASKKVPSTPNINALTADLELNFDQLSCDDEGDYACSVDGMFTKSSSLIVKTLPQGKPRLDLQSNIFSNRKCIIYL